MLSQNQHSVVISLVQTPTKVDMPAFLGECINQSVKRWEVVTCNFFSKILPKFTAHQCHHTTETRDDVDLVDV